MSVEPDQPSPDSAPQPPADPDATGTEALRAKRRFKKGGSEAGEGENPDPTIQMLSTLLQDLITKKEAPSAAEAEAKTAKYHRLSKTGTGTSGATPEPAAAATPGTSPAAPADSLANDAPVRLLSPPPLPPVTFRPAPVLERRFRSEWLWLSLLGGLAFVGLTYATILYFLPPPARGNARTKEIPAPTGTWTDAALGQLDQALAADQAGDLPKARQLASALKKLDAPSPPGLDLYLAGLGTRGDRYSDVEADLLRAVTNAPPQAAGAIEERLAFNASRARDFDKASGFFKAAIQLDPFSAPLYYHWGETLRHLGHFQDAAAVFDDALKRIPAGQPETASLRECINLKERLALIEQGRDGEFQTELAEQLKVPLPSGYWLLTAAAVALQHKNLPEAAGFLGRARDALGGTQFDELLNDYFFNAYADRPELAGFFPLDAVARKASLVPTMTYTIEP